MILSSQGDPVVIMDIDGVVYDFVGQLAVAAAAELGCSVSKFPPAEVWDFMTEQWGWTAEEFFGVYERCVALHGLYRDGIPLPGSIVGWAKLRDLGIGIHVVTDCGPPQNPEPARAARLAWLDEWGFEFDAVTFTSDKAAVAAGYVEQERRVFSLEDRPKNFDALHVAGALSFLRTQRWNRTHRVPHASMRVADVADFADLVATLTQHPVLRHPAAAAA